MAVLSLLATIGFSRPGVESVPLGLPAIQIPGRFRFCSFDPLEFWEDWVVFVKLSNYESETAPKGETMGQNHLKSHNTSQQ